MKRLCVLQVTPTAPTPDHVEFFDNQKDCDFYFVTHDAPHPDALKYCPNTTWVDTRNILAELVPREYEYYAFVDYDFKFYPQGDLGVREQILADLEKFEPAVLTYYPGPGFHTPFNSDTEYFQKYDHSVIPFTHCGMKVIHHSLLDWFFPMLTRFGGGVEACHMFNIQEIPFLNNVVCSHKMIYDNVVTDMETPHNVDGQWSMFKMNQSWEWIMPAFKKNSFLVKFGAGAPRGFRWDMETERFYPTGGYPVDQLDSLDIKNVFINIFKNRSVVPTVSPKDINYYDEEKLNRFFDLNHEQFHNKHLALSEQSLPIGSDFKEEIETYFRNNVTFKTMKSRENPWIKVVDGVNKQLQHRRNITITEAVEIFQKMDDNEAIFYKNSQKDPRLEEYLAGKRVAIVGPAPYLIGKNQGSEIDSYDVVVRIQPEIHSAADYGCRTDIIQSCMNSNYSPKIVKYLEGIDPEKYPKFIICNNTVARETSQGSKIWSDVVEEYDTYLKKFGVPFVHLKNVDGSFDRWALYWEIYAKKYIERIDTGHYTPYSANLNSGYGAYSMLLRYPIKELATFGLDFYQFGEAQGIEDRYNPEYIKQQGEDGTYLGPTPLLHDVLAQVQHCRNVLLKDRRFKYDEDPLKKLTSERISQRIEVFKELPRISVHGIE